MLDYQAYRGACIDAIAAQADLDLSAVEAIKGGMLADFAAARLEDELGRSGDWAWWEVGLVSLAALAVGGAAGAVIGSATSTPVIVAR